MHAVYKYWVHANYGIHMSGGILYDRQWHIWKYDLAVLPSRHYDAPRWKMGQNFVQALSADFTGV